MKVKIRAQREEYYTILELFYKIVPDKIDVEEFLFNPAFYGGSGKPNHSESDEKILPEIFHINPPSIWPRSIVSVN